MNGIFDLPARLINGAKISASYINKLIDSIRRRTIIAGRGIITQSTPNGTVVSVIGNMGGNTLISGSGDAPWKVRYSGGKYQVYIPDGALSIRIRKSDSAVQYLTMKSAINSVLNTSTDGDWYDFATAIPELSKDVVCNIYDDLKFGVCFEGYAAFNATGNFLSSFPIAHIESSSEIEQIAVGSYMADITIPPQYGTQLRMSPTNGTTLTDAILAASGGSGGGSDLVPSSAIPQFDTTNGNAGTSEAYSRGDHSHPLQVDDNTAPSMVDPTVPESDAGSSEAYARADHVHGADFMANSANSGVGVDSLMPDGGEDGMGAVGGSSKAAPIDHSHPLNDDIEGNDVGVEIDPLVEGAESDVDYKGQSKHYALADHTHPLYNVAPLADKAEAGITDALMQPDGGGEDGDGTGDIGFDSGDGTDVYLAAPISHQHPLNCAKDASNIKAAAKDGDAGTAKTYARTDHVHPIPTPELTNINGILGFPVQGAIHQDASQQPTSTTLPFNDTEWIRDSATVNGFTISVLCRLTRNESGQVVGWFRDLTFDKYGAVRKVSAVTIGEILETY